MIKPMGHPDTLSSTAPSRPMDERPSSTTFDNISLARLMVKHDIGVRPKMSFEVKRIDEDYFDLEDL